MAYTRKEYTPEERAAYNAQKQAEMDEMIRRIDEGVKAVFQSEKYNNVCGSNNVCGIYRSPRH